MKRWVNKGFKEGAYCMNQVDYALMNLNMISRVALLEEAKRSQESIDYLASILRYMKQSHESVGTIKAELEIIDKMFFLFKQKKGDYFQSIMSNNMGNEVQYIPKGIIVDFIDATLRKNIKASREKFEVKVIVSKKDEALEVAIQDNGEVGENIDGMPLDEVYKKIKSVYVDNQIKIIVEVKKNIGTKVMISLRFLS